LVGKYIGAKNESLTKKIVKLTFLWGLGFGIIFTLIFLFFGEHIVGIFTNKPELIALSMSFIIWTIFAPIINSFCYIWDGIYIGATASSAMRNSTFVTTILIFIPTFYLTINLWGNHALWFSMTVFMIARGVTLSVLARKHIFNPIKS